LIGLSAPSGQGGASLNRQQSVRAAQNVALWSTASPRQPDLNASWLLVGEHGQISDAMRQWVPVDSVEKLNNDSSGYFLRGPLPLGWTAIVDPGSI
jgi:hypothetical protein